MLVNLRHVSYYCVEVPDGEFADMVRDVETDMGDDPNWYLANVAEWLGDDEVYAHDGKFWVRLDV